MQNHETFKTGKKKLPKLVYIMAPSYTGSTLLTYLLAMHPDITTIGELKASAMGDIDHYTCSCGALIRECGFWSKVINEAREQNIPFSLEDFGTHFRDKNYLHDRLLHAGVKNPVLEMARTLGFNLLPQCRKKRDSIVLQNWNLIEIIKAIQGGSVFLDGSKDPNRVKYFYSSGYWNIRIIYLIRDGRGATNSYMRHYNVNMETALYEWIHTHQECDRIKKIIGRDCLTIHYEDLCRNPDDILARIFNFIGLDVGSISTDFRSVEHHILGNAMRMASTSGIRLDEKWKQSLTKDNLDIFQRKAGMMNHEYGYK